MEKIDIEAIRAILADTYKSLNPRYQVSGDGKTALKIIHDEWVCLISCEDDGHIQFTGRNFLRTFEESFDDIDELLAGIDARFAPEKRTSEQLTLF